MLLNIMRNSGLAARLRLRIEDELAELVATSEASTEGRAPVKLDQQSVGRLTRMDAMQVQAMAVAAERRRRVRIAGLKAALSRLEHGEFGECAECGEPIAPGRLDFDPTAQLCVSCARRNGR